MDWYYVEARNFVCVVGLKDGKVYTHPPILRKFDGQELGNLVRWIEKIGGSITPMD